MTRPLLVGNDVVDLADRRCEGKSGHDRFLLRVFSPEEIHRIRSSSDPDVSLWMRWAGKEASYKVVSKRLGRSPPFQHARYVTDVVALISDEPWPVHDRPGESCSPEASTFRGSVRYGDLVIPVRFEVTTESVHAIAWQPAIAEEHLGDRIDWAVDMLGPGDGETWRNLASRFTAREWKAIHSRASAEVRLVARHAAVRRLGYPQGKVEILCPEGDTGRAPPVICVGGVPGHLDVSLSHHGRFIAWALSA
jgi:hypothetical protein